VPGFPVMLHHEAESPMSPGGFLVVDLLGPSLKDLWLSQNRRTGLSGQMLLRVGREVLRLLRALHLAGFVHNDVKPANVLLGAGSTLQPTGLHLIDFGSCTQDANHAGDGAVMEPLACGPIGTALFASIAADGCDRPTCPADDIESLAYNLAYLARGSLPWEGKPDALALSLKRELLASNRASAELTDDLQCATAAAALQALWTEVRRCNGGDVDYDACLAALGGGSWNAEEAEADAFSEFSFMAALGGGSSEVAEEALVSF